MRSSAALASITPHNTRGSWESEESEEGNVREVHDSEFSLKSWLD